MPAPLGKKTVLITGCTPGGIGHALCLAFHEQGLCVIATARRPETIDDLRQLGIITLQLDVTNEDSIAACNNAVHQLTEGKLDFLVNNAGLPHTIPATDIDLQDVRLTFETNVFGVMAMVQAFVPLLIPTRGLIMMMSSVASVSPYVFGSVFCATKGAINSYSRTLRQELRPFGVRVMVCMAGTIKTSIPKRSRELLPHSIYRQGKELFEKKLKYSKSTTSISAEEFSRQVVREALKGEGWFGGWVARTPDWYWSGGSAMVIWALQRIFGEWLLDGIAYRKFGLPQLEAVVAKGGSKSKTS